MATTSVAKAWKECALHRVVGITICSVLLLAFTGPHSRVSLIPGDPGSYAASHVSVETTNPSTGSLLNTDVYYPSSNGGVNPQGAPYPTLVFARGYLTVPSYYANSGNLLASWGYIVAIPDFPSENVETRASDAQYLLTYLQDQNANGASLFFDKLDLNRLGIMGHSLGGLTTLMVAARDSRVQVAVALDPVNPPSLLGVGSWDYASQAPEITVPLTVLGAPSQLCNDGANYNSLYPYVGSEHKALYVFANASHCDFQSQAACYQACFDGGAYDSQRIQLINRYLVSWLEYYVGLQTADYTYLYGAQSDADVQAGLLATRSFQTAPRGLTAAIQSGGIRLTWTPSNYPIVSGYNVYRTQQSGSYGSAPYVQVGHTSVFTDTNITAEQTYYYLLRSRDMAGNLFQASGEVHAQNHAPVAVSDAYTVNANTELIVGASLGVLHNDTDADGDALQAVLWGGPAHGSLNLNPDGSFSYIPAGGYHGTDNFTYRAFDGTAYSNIASVSITVSGEPANSNLLYLPVIAR